MNIFHGRRIGSYICVQQHMTKYANYLGKICNATLFLKNELLQGRKNVSFKKVCVQMKIFISTNVNKHTICKFIIFQRNVINQNIHLFFFFYTKTDPPHVFFFHICFYTLQHIQGQFFIVFFFFEEYYCNEYFSAKPPGEIYTRII